MSKHEGTRYLDSLKYQKGSWKTHPNPRVKNSIVGSLVEASPFLHKSACKWIKFGFDEGDGEEIADEVGSKLIANSQTVEKEFGSTGERTSVNASHHVFKFPLHFLHHNILGQIARNHASNIFEGLIFDELNGLLGDHKHRVICIVSSFQFIQFIRISSRHKRLINTVKFLLSCDSDRYQGKFSSLCGSFQINRTECF